MTGRWLEEAVEACGLPPHPAFPRDLAGDVVLTPRLCLAPVPLADLTSDDVQSWLSQREMPNVVTGPNRPLHGCLVAQAGAGFLLFDSQDDESEQRFTLAHEVSHFVLEHLVPRAQALSAFGKAILPVLDGERPPTKEESLSFVLDRVPLGTQVRLMDRGPSGCIWRGKVAEVERRADRLALELLAPATLALTLLKGVSKDLAEAQLASRFGLPTDVARMYARMLLCLEETPRAFIQDLFGKDER